MLSIWKYDIKAGSNVIEMPENAKLLDVQTQGNNPVLWVLVDPSKPKEKRYFIVVGTGWKIEFPISTYIGTFQLDDGLLVFHLFEK